MDFLKSVDTQSFLLINGIHTPVLDFIMYWLSERFIWIPMYLVIAIFIIRHYRWESLLIFAGVALTITLCDQISSSLIKNCVERLRPSHEPTLAGLVHLSKAGAGGIYGFVSSHATNVFGLTTFLFFVLDSSFKGLKFWLFIWAVLVSYSRIYNGVHYPWDVIVAALLGFAIGWSISKGYHFLGNLYIIKIRQHRENQKS